MLENADFALQRYLKNKSLYRINQLSKTCAVQMNVFNCLSNAVIKFCLAVITVADLQMNLNA